MSLKENPEEKFYFYLLLTSALATTLFIIHIILPLHRNFIIMPCDTAEFNNAIVNTLHGQFFRNSAYDGPNLLGVHTSFILLLIAPFYAFFYTPEFLFILQVCGIYSSVIFLYLIFCEIPQKPWKAFILASLFLVSPLFFQMATGPFHPETFITCFVLAACYFNLKGQFIPFLVALLLGASCGEEGALIELVLGLALLFSNQNLAGNRKFGWSAFILGAFWFFLCVGVIIPFMHVPGQTNVIAYHYPSWEAKNAFELAEKIILNPFTALGMMLNPARWIYAFTLVGIPLFFAFTSWQSALLLFPALVYFFMSSQEFFMDIHGYYFQPVMIAAIFGLILFLKKEERSEKTFILFSFIALLLNVAFCIETGAVKLALSQQSDPSSAALHEMFNTLPLSEPVMCQHRFSAYLSMHPDMLMFDPLCPESEFRRRIEESDRKLSVTFDQIQYIVCDLINDQYGSEFFGFDQAKTQARQNSLNSLLATKQWSVFWHQGNVMVLKRN